MGKRGPMPKNKMPVETPMVASADKERERRYRAEDALRAISRAEEVKADKGLMKDVKQLAREQADNLKKIAK
jgi:hypothetical protein